MRKQFLWSVACTVVSLMLLTAQSHAAVAADTAGAANARATGVVSDSNGQPLSLAAVTLYTDPPNMQATVMTQKNGSFSVELAPGTYGVIADLRGYAENEPQRIDLRPGQTVNVKVALKPDTNGFDLESQISGSELLALMPEDSRKVLIHRCGSCHTLGVLGGNRMSAASWAKVVHRMSLKEPGGRGEADTLAPWEQNPWSGATEVLAKHFGPGTEAYRYDPFPVHNDPDVLPKIVMKEYLLKRPETNVHDITVDQMNRVWYDDQESGEVVKYGYFGYYDPATHTQKEYQLAECPGLGGRILTGKDGKVWAGCSKALAYVDPKTDKMTVFPMPQYGMRELWTVDSENNAYTILRGRNVDPNGDPKYSFIGQFNTNTKEWKLFKVPTAWGNPYEVNTDSKDNIWFTEIATDKIGKLDPHTGKITEYPVPTKAANPRRFAIDGNDNVWFTEFSSNKIGMVDAQTGKVTEYEVPTPYSIPYACGVDKNGNVWFSEVASMRLGRFDPKTKKFREYPIADRLSSIKRIDFTYVGGKEVVWASNRTGPKIISLEIPE